MELKLGSVMLLLSCSLQQSLWGILASVAQTNANKCKNKISSEGEPTKRVQMIRRIPARCSGWDEAWSWISNKDCRTKYILDYVELPSAVQKVDPEDCKEEVAPITETKDFNLADEKYLAIAFGSATVALLILIVIIVISVVRRGHNRCRICSSGTAYSSANASEREHLDAGRTTGNEYVDDEFKLTEPMYEEIHDHATAMKKLEFNDDLKPTRYQNVQDEEANEKSDVKHLPLNGVHRRPVTPSAPYEEELQQTNRKCVPNDYSVLRDRPVQNSGNINQEIKNTDKTSENLTDIAANECNEVCEQDDHKAKPVVEVETFADHAKDIQTLDGSGLPSNSVSVTKKHAVDDPLPSDSVSVTKKHTVDDPEDKISQKSSHSYENLHKSGTPSGEYDSLVTDDFTEISPMLQEQTGDQCVSTSPPVSNSDRTSLGCVDTGNMSTPVKLAPLPISGECSVNPVYVQPGESSDNVTDCTNISVGLQENVAGDNLENAEIGS